jgi:hypothetical protein
MRQRSNAPGPLDVRQRGGPVTPAVKAAPGEVFDDEDHDPRTEGRHRVRGHASLLVMIGVRGDGTKELTGTHTAVAVKARCILAKTIWIVPTIHLPRTAAQESGSVEPRLSCRPVVLAAPVHRDHARERRVNQLATLTERGRRWDVTVSLAERA